MQDYANYLGAGNCTLRQLLLGGALRASYNSRSALFWSPQPAHLPVNPSLDAVCWELSKGESYHEPMKTALSFVNYGGNDPIGENESFRIRFREIGAHQIWVPKYKVKMTGD